MSTRDADLRKQKGGRRANIPVRSGAGTVCVEDKMARTNPQKNARNALPENKHNSAASHTYDIGYKKWESFREDADSPQNGSFCTYFCIFPIFIILC